MKREVKVLAPFIETLNKPQEFGRLFGKYHMATKDVVLRAERAEKIRKFLNVSNGEYLAYEAMMQIMNSGDEYARLALYVPFEFMFRRWNELHEDYLMAWRKLFSHRDVRESFNIGDVYEPEASRGEPERIVKCLHLLPWMVESGVLKPDEVFELLDEHKDDLVFCSCVYDCLEMFEAWPGMNERKVVRLQKKKFETNYQRPKPELLYATEARLQWLKEREQMKDGMPGTTTELFLKRVNGPFSRNFRSSAMEKIAEGLAEKIGPDEVVLIGGSRVKGYNTEYSDYDSYRCSLSALDELDPNEVHKVFDMFWLSADPEIEKKRAAIAAKYMALPAGSLERRQCINRLEADLLQFRLMHKGFPQAFGENLSRATREYVEIDGASAFYDSRYRAVATMLYAKYVYLPQF